jgi:8-amino-7-oxononanoate synthase
VTPVLDDYRAQLERELAALDEAGLRRTLVEPRGIDFVSNDYLGLAGHPTVIARMRAALPIVGAGSGGSRLLRGHHRYFTDTEERLAAFTGTEAALLFSSGYAANVGVLQALATPDTLVLSDEANHASLIDGVRLSGARKVIYPHQDLGAVERILRGPRPGRTFIVTESLFSMDGDLTPLPELADLAERHGALLVVDEAHATGLYGTRGSGRIEETGVRDRVLLSIHTGGKALGTGGAWVAAPAPVRDALLHRARSFMFSTAPLPVLCAGLEAALDVVSAEPARRATLFDKSERLRTSLRDAGWPIATDRSPIVPVVVGANEAAVALQQGLADAGFDARAVRPPTVPKGTARLRLTVRHAIADDDLARLAAEIVRLATPPVR